MNIWPRGILSALILINLHNSLMPSSFRSSKLTQCQDDEFFMLPHRQVVSFLDSVSRDTARASRSWRLVSQTEKLTQFVPHRDSSEPLYL